MKHIIEQIEAVISKQLGKDNPDRTYQAAPMLYTHSTTKIEEHRTTLSLHFEENTQSPLSEQYKFEKVLRDRYTYIHQDEILNVLIRDYNQDSEAYELEKYACIIHVIDQLNDFPSLQLLGNNVVTFQKPNNWFNISMKSTRISQTEKFHNFNHDKNHTQKHFLFVKKHRKYFYFDNKKISLWTTEGKKSFSSYGIINDYFLIRTTSTISFDFKNFRWNSNAWIDGAFEQRMEFFCNFEVAHKESQDHMEQLALNELKNPKLEDRPYLNHWHYREVIVHTDNGSHSRKFPIIRSCWPSCYIRNFGEIDKWISSRSPWFSVPYLKRNFFYHEIQENESAVVMINGIIHGTYNDKEVFAIYVSSIQDNKGKGAVFTIWNTDNHQRNQFLEVLNISNVTDSLRKRLLLHRDKDIKKGRYLNPQYRFEWTAQETAEETRIRQLPSLLEFLNIAKERKRPEDIPTKPWKSPPRFFSNPVDKETLWRKSE